MSLRVRLTSTFRNHKNFACPDEDCDHITKRRDQLKVHLASKHAGDEYAWNEEPGDTAEKTSEDGVEEDSDYEEDSNSDATHESRETDQPE